MRMLGRRWLADHGEDFGLDVDIDSVAIHLKGILKAGGVILAAIRNQEVVGFLPLMRIPSYMGRNDIALEQFWYVIPEHTGVGYALLRRAKIWAQAQGCSHLIMTASNMASEMHDEVCRFYERTGFRKLETNYICDLRAE